MSMMGSPAAASCVILANLLAVVTGIESPQYTVIHSESDFEIRVYRESTWMSASSDKISFEKATKLGFHRLFQYIQGANLNSSRIRMTTPVLTSIVPDAGPLHSSAYSIRFYLPSKFHAYPPIPLPELNLHPVHWPTRCVAIRQFSGFARDNNIVKEAEKLAVSLRKSPWANSTDSFDKNSYSIAQYNSPFHFVGRINEVWADIDASKIPGCESGRVAAY
ncbi:heme-binding protein 2-like [Phalaenopsis equestris]|uniref:heme-binding protein 2-like n=1 Tax=Phalaenopsis equestris TaxID=78828 RepID=UPI0009E4E700|nr:heme-binding protein 2-like [Phalaenopsis equestris]